MLDVNDSVSRVWPSTNAPHSICFLIFGADQGDYPFLVDVYHTTNPGDAFDAIAVMPSSNPASVFRTLLVHERLLAPIANFSGDPLIRQDYMAPAPTLTEFHQAAEAISSLIQRIRRHADPADTPDRNALLALALSATRQCSIEAQWAPDRPEGVRYPLLYGMQNMRPMLEELAESQLLRRRFFDRVHVCKHCGSSRLNVREECVQCRGSNLQTASLIHHYPCAHLGPESSFQQDGDLFCPKCKKRLRHYGVDYDRPGTVQICGGCGEDTAEPEVGFVCLDCHLHMDGASIDTRNWYHYDLLPDGFAALDAGVLPYRTLESAIQQIPGAVSILNFANILRITQNVCKRYERAMTVWQININNIDTLRELLGSHGLNSMFTLCAEVIAQTIRDTDVVAASLETIFILMPETHPKQAEAVLERIRHTLKNKIAKGIDIGIDVFDSTTAQDLLDRLK